MVLVVVKEMKVTLTVKLTIIKLQPVVRRVIYKESFSQLLLNNLKKRKLSLKYQNKLNVKLFSQHEVEPTGLTDTRGEDCGGFCEELALTKLTTLPKAALG